VQYYQYHSFSQQDTCEDEEILCAEFEQLPVANNTPIKVLDVLQENCHAVASCGSTLVHRSFDTEIPATQKALIPEETSPLHELLASKTILVAKDPSISSPTTKTRQHRNQSQETIVFDYRPPSGDECSLISFTEYEGKIGSTQSISCSDNASNTITKHSFGCQVTEIDIHRAVNKFGGIEKVVDSDNKPKKVSNSSMFEFGFCGMLSLSSDSSYEEEEKMALEGFEYLHSTRHGKKSYTRSQSTTHRRRIASTCMIS
jgi:hypothetical protein